MLPLLTIIIWLHSALSLAPPWKGPACWRPLPPRAVRSATPLQHRLKKDRSRLEPATQKVPAKQFAYYRFLPASEAPSTLSITINGTSGIEATAFVANGSDVTAYPFSPVSGATLAIPGFGSSSEAVPLVANTTDVDGQQAAFSTDESMPAVKKPAGGSVYSSGSTPKNTVTTSSG